MTARHVHDVVQALDRRGHFAIVLVATAAALRDAELGPKLGLVEAEFLAFLEDGGAVDDGEFRGACHAISTLEVGG